MEEIEILKIINSAKRVINNESSTIEQFDRAERNLRKVIRFASSNDNRGELFLAKLLYAKKEYPSSITNFNIALKKGGRETSCYLGLYKSYVANKQYELALNSLNLYAQELQNKNILFEFSFVKSLFNYILSEGKEHNEVDKTTNFMSQEITNPRLLTSFQKLLESYNNNYFTDCTKYILECISICKQENIFLEFHTLKNLITEARKIYSANINKNSTNTYQQLEESIKEQNYNLALELVKVLSNFQIKNQNLFLTALFVLIKNNYHEEVESLLENLFIVNKNKEAIRVLRNAIEEQRYFNTLTEEQKSVYYAAINQGHDAYQAGNLPLAYDIYTWGLYITEAPIFKYYIGKILYKLGCQSASIRYFDDYIKVGSDKIPKTYLYRSVIASSRKKSKDASKYANLCNGLNFIYQTDFFMDGAFLYENEEDYDETKYYNQLYKRNIVDQFEILAANEQYNKIKELFETGRVEEAEKMLNDMEKNVDNSATDRRTLSLINQNYDKKKDSE